MWPAVSLGDIFDRAARVTDPRDPLGERLVSMVFAPPTADLWTELGYSVGYLDSQTGDAWDLFFVGVPAIAKRDSRYGFSNWSEYFQPNVFRTIAVAVRRRQEEALEHAGLDVGAAWTHTGGADLVSVLSHRGEPDWLSLTACRLDERRLEPVTLAEVAARQATWAEGTEDELFHGARYQTVGGLDQLGSALQATALVIAGGVAGNAAYDLINSLIAR